MFARVMNELRGIAGGLEPEFVSPADAARLLDDVATVKKLAEGIETLLASRAAASRQWRREGASDEAEWLARKTGTTKARAAEVLKASAAVGSQPEVEAALRQGELSGEQAATVSDAAAADPSCATAMVAQAKADSVTNLRRQRDRIKAAACPDPDVRRRRIHAERRLRFASDAEGAGLGWWRWTSDAQGEFTSRLTPFLNAEFDRARLEGRREPYDAYAADALLAMARAATEASRADEAGAAAGKPDDSADGTGEGAGERATASTPIPPRHRLPAKVIVRIDHAALVRGRTVAGETCDWGGAPVPVSVVDEMLASGDAFLAAVVTKGVDVLRVVHLGRRPNAHQLTALQWRDVVCARAGCSAHPSEWDHVTPFAGVKATTLGNLRGLCSPDHDLKTYEGYRVVPSALPGRVDLVPPEEPTPPRGPAPPEEQLLLASGAVP